MPTSMLPLTTETTPGLRRLTSEEYHAMADAGILHEDDRVELLDGQPWLGLRLAIPISPASTA